MKEKPDINLDLDSVGGAMKNKAEQLIQLAETKFDLTNTEIKLLQAVIKGEEANFSSDESELNDPAIAPGWDKNCTLRASLIVWLCTDPIACQSLTYLGFKITGANIEETLDLRFASLGFPLIFRSCIFLGMIRLERAKIKFLDLSDCYLTSYKDYDDFGTELDISLEASGIEIMGDCFLCNGFISTGRIVLDRAKISGNLVCNHGEFVCHQGYALTLNNADIQGNIIGEGLKATGGISLFGACISGSIECCRSIMFGRPQRNSILAQNIQVQGSIRLDGAIAFGCVSLQGATIGNSLSCDNSFFINIDDVVLVIGQAEIKGVVLLGQGFLAIGKSRPQ
ncbi:hypothetical protein HRE53_30010 (plasmid) [Acaryochloris sp. 'Moss Beach']|uniref:hypothetical protein n=1 Tax=Acaryochloris sp. 'Moss Beach' TaxID=2740837 RepID=UPI001F41355E|nr:hypothetical protein [Acaryochloris sp. 'Moss Beach']UJB72969.1 hypothetical protein HRE53_30010 [Acaryochloris sp. 'Moss Beach']